MFTLRAQSDSSIRLHHFVSVECIRGRLSIGTEPLSWCSSQAAHFVTSIHAPELASTWYVGHAASGVLVDDTYFCVANFPRVSQEGG